MKIRTTLQFDRWFGSLKDLPTRVRIQARIDRLGLEHPGDSKSIGGGLHELRIHVGPGFRVYYVENRGEWVVLLAGGDKSTQARDITTARQLADRL